MEYLKKIRLIYRDPKEFFYRLNKYFSWIFIDKIFFVFVAIIFSFFPSYVSYFLPGTLIRKNNRWIDQHPDKDWLFKENPKIIFDEINIICRGDSLKKYSEKIDKNLITFFVNFDKKSLDKFPALQNIPYVGITADIGIKKKLLASGLSPIIHLKGGYKLKNSVIWDKYENLNEKRFSLDKRLIDKLNQINSTYITHFKEFGSIKKLYLGSALVSIFFLSNYSKKINIYGWDHYLEEDVKNFGYFKSMLNLAFKAPNGPWDKRFKFVFSESLWNWFYAYKMTNYTKYNLQSNLSNILAQKNILKRINKIFNY